jgi:16S rRNA processing protein RimM
MLPYNPESNTLRADQQLTLRWADRSSSVRLLAVRPHKSFRLLTLDGYASATAAESLVGAEVCIDTADLPPLRPDEVYHRDLIGLRVETVDGRPLGVVDGVLSTGGNDVCVVRDGAKEHLIPLIADVVRQIDLAGGRLVIEPIPGLLD